MKRVLGLVATICLLCCVLATVPFAKNKTYVLDELGMSVELPEDTIVFTRDIDDNDPNLADLGLTKEVLENNMLKNNIYLNVCDRDVNYEVVITMLDGEYQDYNLYSDAGLKAYLVSFTDEYEAMGFTYKRSEIYQHEQAKFIKLYYSANQGSSPVDLIQYHTSYGGKAINITMHCYSGANFASEGVLKEIVDDVRFNSNPLKKDSATASSFLYKDSLSGVEFTVPENWIKEPKGTRNTAGAAKFISDTNILTLITFTSDDVWDTYTEEKKQRLSRRDIDNSATTAAEIADAFGCTERDVSMVSYGGKEYYKAHFLSTTDVLGAPVTSDITHMVRVENGYMYIFSFADDGNNVLYGDFEAVLNSVVYPGEGSPNNQQSKSTFSLGDTLVLYIITIVLYSLPIIIYRYAIAKKPIEKKKAGKITIIYGIIAVVAMSLIHFLIRGNANPGGAVFFWSFVNYWMLSGGKNKHTNTPQSQADQNDAAVQKRISIKRISIISLLSLLVSILGVGAFSLTFSHGKVWLNIFIIAGILSIILPVFAKIYRIAKNKTGKWMEIISILIGGFNFYSIIFAFAPTMPIFVGFLGWIVCGIVYTCIKTPVTYKTTFANNAEEKQQTDAVDGHMQMDECSSDNDAPLPDYIDFVPDKNGIIACPRCGATQKADRATCFNCNQPFLTKDAFADLPNPIDVVPDKNGIIACLRCGATQKADRATCFNCNQPFRTKENAQVLSDTTPLDIASPAIKVEVPNSETAPPTIESKPPLIEPIPPAVEAKPSTIKTSLPITKDNAPAGRICLKCGSRLLEDSMFCSSCGAPVENPIPETPKVMFCRKCGTKLLEDSDFCHKCGTRTKVAKE